MKATEDSIQTPAGHSPVDAREISHKILALCQAGRHDLAMEICKRLLALAPDNPEMQVTTGMIAMDMGDFDRGVELFSRAVVLQPNNGEYHFHLGNALQGKGQVEAAIERFRAAASIVPDFLGAYRNLATSLVTTGRTQEAIPVLTRVLELDATLHDAHILMARACMDMPHGTALSNYHVDMYHHYCPNANPVPHPEEDSFFVDREAAWVQAMKGATVYPATGIVSTQICYYTGPVIAEGDVPPNLYHVPEERMKEFFMRSRTRLPNRVIFDPADAKQAAMAAHFANTMKKVGLIREMVAERLIDRTQNLQPEFSIENPYHRIFICANQTTELVRSELRELGRTLSTFGHQVTLFTEANKMEWLDAAIMLDEICAVEPHVVIHVNHLEIGTLAPEIFNINLWQKPGPQLRKGNPMPHNRRDIALNFERHPKRGYQDLAIRVDEIIQNEGVPKQAKASKKETSAKSA
ncbi:MAG: tetratricopeptide repeat protein [Magnetococcales bacterium]|nr:tetratricopeptide repeat protein [Magnetococcales bacterium]